MAGALKTVEPDRWPCQVEDLLENRVRAESIGFVHRIGRLTDEPAARRAILELAVRDIASDLLDEFGDHTALAQQLQIASKLAWLGPEALRSVVTADGGGRAPV